MFTTSDYLALHDRVFLSDYTGYKPTVTEIPNGDGKADATKRYAQVATKYLLTWEQKHNLMPYLEYAHGQAEQAARGLGIAEKYMPRIEFGALRIIDYPPGAISNMHRDFDLFTLMMYRDQPDRFVMLPHGGCYVDDQSLRALHTMNAQGHIGELGSEIGLGPATTHEVLPSERTQRSIVYFAIPDHDAVLPNGVAVRDWLNERMARSRTEFKKYE